MDHTVHGILQVRILEWVPFPSPRDLPNPGTEPRSPTLQVDYLLAELQGKLHKGYLTESNICGNNIFNEK